MLTADLVLTQYVDTKKGLSDGGVDYVNLLAAMVKREVPNSDGVLRDLVVYSVACPLHLLK